jgi:hypothetical protein
MKSLIKVITLYISWSSFLLSYHFISFYLRYLGLITISVENSAMSLRENPFVEIFMVGFIIFVARNKRIPYLFRFHTAQNILIILTLRFIDTVAYFLPASLTVGNFFFHIYSCLGILLMSIIVYSAFCILKGKVTDFSFLTSAVKSFINEEK